ncbi:MAG: alpha/beta hydrolase [Ignavibacteriales bacterium]|nr:alpha/beta hydrolase [Ignavibacteriales bacterium]
MMLEVTVSCTPKPDETYYDTGDLKALLEYLNIKKAHICGVSMGSGIIVDFALEYPEMCLSITPTGSTWAVGLGTDEYKSPAADSLFAVTAKNHHHSKRKRVKRGNRLFLDR